MPADEPGLGPARRRLYLMRHGSVDYFRADGTPLPVDSVPLNARGEREADAAGALLHDCGARPDQVLVSGLPRTVQTAQRVLQALGLDLPLQTDTDLQEIRPGRLADLPPDRLREAFTGSFDGDPGAIEQTRFLAGETIGALLDRTWPALQRWLQRDDWRCALWVLHGGVNRALLSTALAGQRAFFGRLEQAPACLNVLDVGRDVQGRIDLVVRAINLAPTQWLHQHESLTTMEKLFLQHRRNAA